MPKANSMSKWHRRGKPKSGFLPLKTYWKGEHRKHFQFRGGPMLVEGEGGVVRGAPRRPERLMPRSLALEIT